MRRDFLLLAEMIEAAERAAELARGVTVDQLQADRQRREALLWNFTVLGEARAQLSDEVKERFPDIPWRQSARPRNRIVHGYWSIDMEVVHTTATDQLPSFTASLREALATLTAEEDEARHSDVRGAVSEPAGDGHADATAGEEVSGASEPQ
jgi:uncharacterized protein with HEPN domain